MKTYQLAIDLGATSGRHVLSYLEDGKMQLEEIYRFPNSQIERDGHVCWDIEALWGHIVAGLKKCKELDKIPVSIGLDTWGVDYVLVDEDGKPVRECIAYRDERTKGVPDEVFKKIPADELYSKCGLQQMDFNTLYQLAAHKKEWPEDFEKASQILFVPDYFIYRLTGIMLNEYTEASTSNMIKARSRDWDRDLIEDVGLPHKIFTKPTQPGVIVGCLVPELVEELGFDTKVILTATHDTGSAYIAVPAKDDNSVSISSGTWSLLGVLNDRAITSEDARLAMFTNEGGYCNKYCFLQNIMGLWMISSIRREFNGVSYVEGRDASKHCIVGEGEEKISFPDLIEMAKEADKAGLEFLVNANDSRFMAPASMIDEIKAACKESGQAEPQTPGEIALCVYKSLAKCYADAIKGLSGITDKKYTSINIIGGGSQDMYLNQQTANACRIPVYAGPIEGTCIGNLIVQYIQNGSFKDVEEAHECIRRSFPIREVIPE